MRVGVASGWFPRGIGYMARQVVDAANLHGHKGFVYEYHPSFPGKYESSWSNYDITNTGSLDEWAKKKKLDVILIVEPKGCTPCKIVPSIACLHIESVSEVSVPNYNVFTGIWAKTLWCEKRLKSSGANKVFYSPFGTWVDERSPRKDWLVERKEIVFNHNAGWGGVYLRKGTPETIKAFDIASSKCNNIRLRVHSQARLSIYGKEVENIIRRNKKISFTEGTIPLVDLDRTRADCDFAIQPSKWEGYGMELVESMALGLPVITTDAPPMNELVKPCVSGFLCTVGSVNEGLGRMVPASNVSVPALVDKISLVSRMSWQTILELKQSTLKYVRADLDWKGNSKQFFNTLKEVIA